MFQIIEKIGSWGLELISTLGYTGLFLSMTLESAAIPLPSEVIVPFSGFLASTGRFDFWLVVLVASLANLTGAIILYFVGFYWGTAFLRKYGKYFLMHQADIEKMERWLQRNEKKVAFFSRVLPGTRTFSSIVIGAGKVRFSVFFWYTLIGSFIWNLPWTYLGYAAGSRWNTFHPLIRKFDYLIVSIIAVVLIVFIYRHAKKIRHNQ